MFRTQGGGVHIEPRELRIKIKATGDKDIRPGDIGEEILKTLAEMGVSVYELEVIPKE